MIRVAIRLFGSDLEMRFTGRTLKPTDGDFAVPVKREMVGNLIAGVAAANFVTASNVLSALPGPPAERTPVGKKLFVNCLPLSRLRSAHGAVCEVASRSTYIDGLVDPSFVRVSSRTRNSAQIL